jgi:hypothetical protein
MPVIPRDGEFSCLFICSDAGWFFVHTSNLSPVSCKGRVGVRLRCRNITQEIRCCPADAGLVVGRDQVPPGTNPSTSRGPSCTTKTSESKPRNCGSPFSPGSERIRRPSPSVPVICTKLPIGQCRSVQTVGAKGSMVAWAARWRSTWGQGSRSGRRGQTPPPRFDAPTLIQWRWR